MPAPKLTPPRLVVLLCAFLFSGASVFTGLSACAKTDAPALAAAKRDAPDAVRSNYPSRVEARASAQEICAAFQSLPRERKAACCAQPRPSLLLTAECTRVVSGALQSGALAVDDGRASRCAEALAARYETCDFVGELALDLPADCDGLLEGQLDDGATCRSSLECKRGLTCAGVSPTETGTCQAPGAAGAVCGRGIDPVASYLGQGVLDEHPECAGFCANQRCRDHAAVGARCVSDEHCGAGAVCERAGEHKVCRAGKRGAVVDARPLDERCVALR